MPIGQKYPGNVLNAFSMANNDSSDNVIIGINLILMLQMMKNGSIQKIEYWFITRMIEKESPCLKKKNFSQISDLAEDILLKKDGFSVIELNPTDEYVLSTC